MASQLRTQAAWVPAPPPKPGAFHGKTRGLSWLSGAECVLTLRPGLLAFSFRSQPTVIVSTIPADQQPEQRETVPQTTKPEQDETLTDKTPAQHKPADQTGSSIPPAKPEKKLQAPVVEHASTSPDRPTTPTGAAAPSPVKQPSAPASEQPLKQEAIGKPTHGDPHPAAQEPEPKLANAGSVSKSHDSSKTPIDRIAPPVAVAPFDETKAKEFQQAWAKHLGVPVEMVDSIGMKLVLIRWASL